MKNDISFIASATFIAMSHFRVCQFVSYSMCVCVHVKIVCESVRKKCIVHRRANPSSSISIATIGKVKYSKKRARRAGEM